jgi:formylglycine-generating enzyme required for sulfatase activity
MTCVEGKCVTICGAAGCVDARPDGSEDARADASPDASSDGKTTPDAHEEMDGPVLVAIDAPPMPDSAVDSPVEGSDAEPSDGSDGPGELDADAADRLLDGGSEDGASCDPLHCHKCGDDGGEPCEDVCSESKGCRVPPSCRDHRTKCGPNLSCCRSPTIPAGSFSRCCDSASCTGSCAEKYPATISAFALDAFEVTVDRFRQFVRAYPHSKPNPGDGKNPNNADDHGWDPSWDTMLPADAEALNELLEKPERLGPNTWTRDPGPNESKPMNFVSWYLAYAFCAWDEGRLPTEAEWNYVAAGGDQQRWYPWSQSSQPMLIDSSYAVYDSSEPANVGTKSAGIGRWGHYDLAGNVGEWMRDAWTACYATPNQCDDCVNASAAPGGKALRGGAFDDVLEFVTVASRDIYATDVQRWSQYGIRCARNP